jgi:hypothetical protein
MLKSKDNSDEIFCEGCGNRYDRRGFTTHQRACLPKVEQRRKDAILEAKRAEKTKKPQGRHSLIVWIII